MKKQTKYIIFICCLALGILLTGCGKVGKTFGKITDCEAFADVPVMDREDIQYSEAADVGGGNYKIEAAQTELADYREYLATLEKAGFQKQSDNGEEGIEGYLYQANMVKDKLVVSVCYIARQKKTMIVACADATLSPNLNYSEDLVKGFSEGAKTTLYMPELYSVGNSFVFQLKNGHFIINDGAMKEDLPYLLEYLDKHTPEGEKPVVDAWIISHAHNDHMGILQAFEENPEYVSRLTVEQFLFTESSQKAQEHFTGYEPDDVYTFYATTLPAILQTGEGAAPTIYRMRLGERYYFADITMDVIGTPDQLDVTQCNTFNSTSVTLMYTVEGQKLMFPADSDWECQMQWLEVFDDDYFKLTVYQAPHHGGNVYNEVSRHLTVDMVLYPSPSLPDERSQFNLLGRPNQNEYLTSNAKEATSWVDGGVLMTFPYEVGTFEKLPLTEWKYSKKLPARLETE